MLELLQRVYACLLAVVDDPGSDPEIRDTARELVEEIAEELEDSEE